MVFGLLILSANGVIITDGEESLKILRQQNNITEVIKLLTPRSELSYYPESHDFGDKNEGEVDNTTFEIWNSGCCKLTYTLSENCSWVDVNPTSGTSYEGDDPDVIYVDINTSGLVWGPYICNISISSNSGDGVFTVTVNIINKGYTNITTGEAWEFLINTSNGIQAPIDIRTNEEWIVEHIDTPSPENPKHHPNLHLYNETQIQEFMSLYNGYEIIIYSKSGDQSEMAAQILNDNKFYGTIYNMLGGIIAWKDSGYPIKSNQPPDTPTITGPLTGTVGIEYNYTFNTTDPEGDYLFYCIDWDDDTEEIWIGPYNSGEEITICHTWDKRGTYTIRAKARDRYDTEGIWGHLRVKMPIIRLLTNSLFTWFNEQNQYLFTLLRYLQNFW